MVRIISGHFLCGFFGWDKWRKLTTRTGTKWIRYHNCQTKNNLAKCCTPLTTVLKLILEFIIEQTSLLNKAALHNHSVMPFLHVYENNYSVFSGLILYNVFKCFAMSFNSKTGNIHTFHSTHWQDLCGVA